HPVRGLFAPGQPRGEHYRQLPCPQLFHRSAGREREVDLVRTHAGRKEARMEQQCARRVFQVVVAILALAVPRSRLFADDAREAKLLWIHNASSTHPPPPPRLGGRRLTPRATTRSRSVG